MKKLICLLFLLGVCLAASADKPNLVIVMTDEHNFRTLGCYRELLPDDQAFVWGKGVKVDTPHIDSIARDGILATSFYASSPVCSPSRVSFMTGLYPHVTGVPKNDVPMHDDMVTFAEVLRREGYATGYLGKWHLDGEGKPQWEPKRKFGWEDNRYMFNRGHYKNLIDTPEGPKVNAASGKDGIPRYDVGDADEKSYTTDFLMDRTLDFIQEHQGGPFCVMLSLPDPHGPNTVRPPYDTRFKHFTYEEPRTLFKTPEQTPDWIAQAGNNYIENAKLNQDWMAAYFGMVQCIDDNVGELLEALQDWGLEENTIVVFTSDHGDLMGEHRRHNKGNHYEASARIPFILKYPGKIQPGKIIHAAMTTADFGPTILPLMDAEGTLPEMHGRDLSKHLRQPNRRTSSTAITYIRASGMNPAWVAAVSDRYKLVISDKGDPWLYDLEKDPDELFNCFEDPAYADERMRLTGALRRQLRKAEDPALTIPGFEKWL